MKKKGLSSESVDEGLDVNGMVVVEPRQDMPTVSQGRRR